MFAALNATAIFIVIPTYHITCTVLGDLISVWILIFQALQYLLKLCSHPLLVLGDKVTEPVASELSAMINGSSDIITELHKVQHSPKLVALQEILEECGIGSDASSSDGTLSVGQHRVLIFAQHKVITYRLILLI